MYCLKSDPQHEQILSHNQSHPDTISILLFESIDFETLEQKRWDGRVTLCVVVFFLVCLKGNKQPQ